MPAYQSTVADRLMPVTIAQRLSRSMIFSLLGFLLLTDVVQAETVTCSVVSASRDLKQHIGKTIRIEYSDDTGVAKVDDGFPKADDLPHRGKVGRDTPTVLSFVWRQPGLVVAGWSGMISLNVRLSINRVTQKAQIAGVVSTTTKFSYSGRANCTFQ